MTEATNKKKRKEQVDPRTTIEYYSMYQSWTDVLMSFVMCLLVVIFSVAVVVLFYLFFVSDHPTMNFFYVVEQIAMWALEVLLKLLKSFAEFLSKY